MGSNATAHMYQQRSMSTISQLLVVFIVHSALLVAAQTDAKKGGGRPRQPLQEALDACAALTSGANCSFTGKHGLKSGACISPPGKPLACKPSASAEAVQACASKHEGAGCQYTSIRSGKSKDHSGQCLEQQHEGASMGCDDPEEDEDSCDGDGTKKMKMVVILCVVAAALLCCCGIGVYCWKRSQRPVMELPVTVSDTQIAAAMQIAAAVPVVETLKGVISKDYLAKDEGQPPLYQEASAPSC